MAYLVAEFKKGFKVYLAEIISLIGLLVFFMILPKMSFMLENNMGMIVVMGWFVLNTLGIIIYTLYDFVRMMLEVTDIPENFLQRLMFKVLFFVIFFETNMFLFMVGSSISVPILALMGTFLVLATTREYFNKKAPYMCLGILWFITLFAVSYFAYKMCYILMYSVIPNQMLIGILTAILFFGCAFFIFITLGKKINQIKS
ncbi:MAG: hypothetical protein ACRCTE_08630 [Cellulosilyticaceae bacterium]